MFKQLCLKHKSQESQNEIFAHKRVNIEMKTVVTKQREGGGGEGELQARTKKG